MSRGRGASMRCVDSSASGRKNGAVLHTARVRAMSCRGRGYPLPAFSYSLLSMHERQCMINCMEGHHLSGPRCGSLVRAYVRHCNRRSWWFSAEVCAPFQCAPQHIRVSIARAALSFLDGAIFAKVGKRKGARRGDRVRDCGCTFGLIEWYVHETQQVQGSSIAGRTL
ncbi:hypothetical protein BC834DRAFT_179758 [Gloeopeniophorella convolvens]|nr:hypothetical protein BC834DRAFT_179758 [Gloeopeniophorella convolvens]